MNGSAAAVDQLGTDPRIAKLSGLHEEILDADVFVDGWEMDSGAGGSEFQVLERAWRQLGKASEMGERNDDRSSVIDIDYQASASHPRTNSPRSGIRPRGIQGLIR
jgi:hypothetical protein